mgnify:CR=1 FL=1
MSRRGCRDCPDEETGSARESDADRELRFHYNREEREGARFRPLPDHSGRTVFRGNRSLMILFIDVVVVLLLGGIYFFFLRGDPSVTTLQGYEFSLSARSFEDETLLSLTVLNQEGSAPSGESFWMELRSPEPEALLERVGVPAEALSSDLRRLLTGGRILDLLPGRGERRPLRLLLPLGLSDRTEITVRVGRGEESDELITAVRPLDE